MNASDITVKNPLKIALQKTRNYYNDNKQVNMVVISPVNHFQVCFKQNLSIQGKSCGARYNWNNFMYMKKSIEGIKSYPGLL